MFLKFNKEGQKESPLVSVVIPCYNYGRFIVDAIDSVLASTYQNIEIIVVDDGPTDPYTIELLRTLKKPKTKVIFQENQGLARARNNGIGIARGKYILPLDADDKIDPTYIEKALYVLETHPKLGIAYGYAKVFGSQDFLWKTGEYSINCLVQENIIPSCSVVRKSAWRKVGGYEPDRYQYDDWTFWIKLASNGYYGRRIAEALFFHRKHSDTENMTDTLQKKHKEYYDKIRKKFPKLFKRRARIFFKVYQRISCIIHRFLPRRVTRIFFKLRTFVSLELMKLVDNLLGNKGKKVFPNFNVSRIDSKNKKKIIIFLPWLSCGGVEKVTLELIKNLSDYEVFLITTQRSEYDYQVDSEFKAITPFVYYLPEFLKEEHFLYFVNDLIDCYGIQTALINHSAWAYENIERIKKNHSAMHFFDILHNTANEGYKTYSAKYSKFISRTIVISGEIRECLLQQFGINKKKVVCILNGIDLEKKFNPDRKIEDGHSRKFEIPTDKFVVTFIGRLSEEKGPMKFLEIALKLKGNDKFFFVMVGDGALRENVVNYIKQNFTQNNFLYVGDYAFPERILKYTSVLLNTSSIEGMPLTLIEALAMRVPVIAPRVGAIHEIVEHEKNGFLLERVPTIKEYVIGLERMITESDLYLKMKECTRKSVERKFSSERMANEYKYVFEELA